MRFLPLLFVLMLFACGKVITLSEDDEYELMYNYQLLKLFFYHPERIKNFSEYEDMEVSSMYEKLNDTLKGYKYTRYYTPEKANDVISGLENSERYFSFGFDRALKKGESSDTLVVVAVYPNSPANDAGLKKRDRLLSANGKSLLNLTNEEIKIYIKNDSLFNAKTVFKILREGDERTLPAMQKEEVPMPTVYLDSLYDKERSPNGVPFITVTEFTIRTNDPKGTLQEFKNVLKEIKGTKTAIIDLRYNPGGNVYHCTVMAAELSPPDKELVYDIEHYADENGRGVVDTVHHFAGSFQERAGDGVDTKWILLVNGGSASCAERFAAAVKASRPETVIIGQPSYGKGIAQMYMKTYLGGAAFITSMQTYFPNGTTFHRVGIQPDIESDPDPYSDDIYEKAFKAAQDFGFALAKRAPINVDLNNLPPKRKAIGKEPGAYKKLEGF